MKKALGDLGKEENIENNHPLESLLEKLDILIMVTYQIDGQDTIRGTILAVKISMRRK